jgi:hypothetical protein
MSEARWRWPTILRLDNLAAQTSRGYRCRRLALFFDSAHGTRPSIVTSSPGNIFSPLMHTILGSNRNLSVGLRFLALGSSSNMLDSGLCPSQTGRAAQRGVGRIHIFEFGFRASEPISLSTVSGVLLCFCFTFVHESVSKVMKHWRSDARAT